MNTEIECDKADNIMPPKEYNISILEYKGKVLWHILKGIRNKDHTVVKIYIYI